MNLRLPIALLFAAMAFSASGQIWTENFNSYPDATEQDPPKWTTVATDCDDGGNRNLGPGASQWGVWAGVFTINDIEGSPCCQNGIEGGGNNNYWESEVIDISDFCNVSASLVVTAAGTMECDSGGAPIFGCQGMTPPDNSHDQVVSQYNLNGGGWVQFGYVCATNGLGTQTIAGLNGNTLQLRVYAANKSNAEYYYFDNVVVNGTAATVPVFNPIGPFCQTAPPVALPTTSNNGVSGNWAGPGVTGNNFNPSGQSGTVMLTFTPTSGQCASPATVNVTVNTPVTPVPSPIGPFCDNAPAVPLQTPINGITGNWSGPGVSANSFNPAGQNGTVTLTFAPTPGQCANPATLNVTVNPAATPNLGTASICNTDPPLNLSTLLDPNYPNGTWSGPGVNGNMFNPSGQNGNVTLTFTSSAPCVQAATTTVTVNPTTTPVLGTATTCQNSPPLNLTTLQDPNYPTGTWSGPGVSGTNFNPAGQNGDVTVTFNPTTPCAETVSTTITVLPTVTPVLSSATMCATDNPLNLTSLQDPDYPNGTWSGPGVNHPTFNPNGQNGTVTVTFTSSDQCVLPATTTITVNQPQTPVLGNATLCQTDPPYNLTQLQDPNFPNGTWSGPGVSGNTFSPGGQNGNVNLTFTPAAGSCGFPATTTVTVTPATTPNLGTATLCQTDPPLNLTTLQDPNFPTGTWSGPGVTGNTFNPAGQSGNVNLIFTPPSGTCTFPGSTTVTVNVPGTPVLGTATLCQTAPPYNLTQLNDPNFPTGTWSGPGVTGNTFNPAGQSGNVQLTFTPSANCSLPASTTITVNVPGVPQLGTASICRVDGPYSLVPLQDPNFPNGAWSGPGVTGSTFNPANQSGNVTLTFTPSANCSVAATTTVTVNLAPTFSNLMDDCDFTTQTYTVSFDISGGTPPYTVNGLPAGTSFTSAPIASGASYSFVLDDANDCGPVVISGTVNCNCATDAGTMDFTNSPLNICHDADIPVNHNGDENLDSDDLLVFVLHDNPGTTLGNVLATSTTTTIANPGGLVLGQTYYVSAVAGSDDGNGNVDFDDPCLSVAPGVPVEFYQPIVTISAPTQICANECAEAQFQFSGGNQPYSVEYDIFVNGVSQGPYQTMDLNFVKILTLCPLTTFQMTEGTLMVEFISITDESGCSAIDLPAITIDVLPTALTNIAPTLCPGEGIVVNGTQYDEANPTGQEVFGNGAQNGCDSVVNVNLSFFPVVETFIDQTLCPGGSVTVNGTVYDQGNPDGTEIMVAANGCDSTIYVDLDFSSGVSFNLNPTLCNNDSVLVNSVWYWSGNPSGSQTFPGGSYLGCDSTVIVNLSFFPPATANLNPQLCTGGSITINGTVYDEGNPNGQEILPNASVNGCDSTINVNVSFLNEVFENLNPTLCPGESVTVNGTVYDEAMPSGSETFPMGSYLGCDSTVLVGLVFFPSANFDLVLTLCPGETITVNGNVYGEANPDGTEVFQNATANGCDSTVIIDLSFFPSANFNLVQTLCPGGSVTVNGTVYDETNPTGTEVLQNASANGCDSTVFVNLTFSNGVFSTLDPTLCPGESVTVNGNIYNQANPSGSETYPMGSYLGCDSTVLIDLGFFPSANFDLIQTLCTGGSTTVNGTVYNESNPSGTEILQDASANGCDSTVNVSLSFVTEVFEDLDPELCAGEVIIVNGNEYSETNPFGEETFPNGSFFGCDSTVVIDLSFMPPVEFNLTETFCTGGSITVNGTVYNEANPNGVEVFQNGAANGCDSTVYVNISFDDEVFENLDPVLCPGESVFVNGTLYFEGNPTGSETFPMGSYLGCDSTVLVNLSFFPEANASIDSTLMLGQTVTVNGTVYSQTNPSGVEVITGGSWTGCDSTVVVNLLFEGALNVFFSATSPTCVFGNDGSIRIDSITGGELPYIISLNGGLDMSVFLFPEFFTGLEPGFYSLTVRDAVNTVATVEIFIDNPPVPTLDLGPDLILDLGQSVVLSAETDFQPATYQWEPLDFLDCTDCPEPRSTPADDITYTLLATTPDGCEVSDEVTILLQKSREVYAPNVFSPNNDGVNDEFTLFSGAQVAKVNRLLIFDRWGALMFENYNFDTNNLSIGWTGRYKGELLNSGVYVWFAEVEFLDGKVELFEGEVMLVR